MGMETGGFDLSVMPQDYSYVMPNAGMPNQSFDWSQPSFASMENFGGFGGGQSQPQSGMGSNYAGTSDVLRSYGSYSGQPDTQGWQANPQAQFSQDQSFAPSTGKATGSAGSQQAANKDDDWKKMLLKMGLGGGIGALGKVGAAAIGAMGDKGQPQQSQPMPQAPSQATPAAAPLLPLPGTKASPLISGMPNQAQGSLGLQTQDRMRHGGSTGGFQLY